MTTEKTTPAAASNAAPQTPAVEDDFDAVFAEITSEGSDGKPADGTAAPAAAKPADDGAADEGAAPAPAADAAADGAPAAPAGAAAEPTDAEKLAAAQARVAELEAAKPPVADAKPPAETPATDTPAAETPIEWYKPTEQEAEVLSTFDKEWPEVSAALAVRNKVDIFNAVQYMFAQVAKSYGPKMQRFEEVAEAVEEMATLNALRGAHNDYDTIHDKVVSWVEAMPVGFQKRAAQAVLSDGSTEDVTELIAEYKKANPQPLAAVPAAAAGAAPAAKGKTELSAAAKKAANALSMVDSKRTAQTAAVDPNDFDGAWTEATGSSR